MNVRERRIPSISHKSHIWSSRWIRIRAHTRCIHASSSSRESWCDAALVSLTFLCLHSSSDFILFWTISLPFGIFANQRERNHHSAYRAIDELLSAFPSSTVNTPPRCVSAGTDLVDVHSCQDLQHPSKGRIYKVKPGTPTCVTSSSGCRAQLSWQAYSDHQGSSKPDNALLSCFR